MMTDAIFDYITVPVATLTKINCRNTYRVLLVTKAWLVRLEIRDTQVHKESQEYQERWEELVQRDPKDLLEKTDYL